MTFIGAGNTINTTENTIYFDIVHKDKIIGNLKATKISKGENIYYQSVTSIKTKIINEIDINYLYDVVYENDKLKKANVIIDVNDKTYANILTIRKNDAYQITKNDKKEMMVNDDIHFATILLYFKEPIEISKCYSEQDASFNTISPMGNHSYKKVNSKNHENVYYYKNGILEEAEIDGGLVKFKLIAHE